MANLPLHGNSSNPYGMNQGERADWAKDLEGVTIIDGSGPFDHEYLYFVGCAGSFDDRNKKTSRAFAKLMQRAGVDFAILGPGELCNGDPARRSGNEYIFQMLAMQNIETLNSLGVKKIVTQCPHCFNTLTTNPTRRPLRGDLLVSSTTEAGQRPATGGAPRRVTTTRLRLGRHNDVYCAPGCRSLGASSWARGRQRTKSFAAAPAEPACGWRSTSARR